MNFNIISGKVLAGKEINKEEGLFLLRMIGEEERNLLALAAEMNSRLNGNRVTYVKNRNLNFTNICAVKCKFCGFCRGEGEQEAFTLSVDEILQKLKKNPDVSEFCIQGGINPRLDMAYYLNFLRQIKRYYPAVHIHGISPQEVDYLVVKTGWSLEKVIQTLMEAGLDSMAGTAAEILVDEIREKIAPAKIPTGRWVEIIRTAHSLGLKSTATILIGHIEKATDIIDHLDLLRGIQKETQGFTEFIPLLFIPYQTPLGADYSLSEIIPWAQIRRFYALARVYLFPSFKNIQTSWVKLGADRAMETLEVGVNDFGGTLFEENITRSAGGKHGQYLSEEVIRKKLLRVGKVPIWRDTLYRLLEKNESV
jgi:5-amino-6-(D-ribitylamino)uracil---L-tyrosine 4-hydroxyphenyl transferase